MSHMGSTVQVGLGTQLFVYFIQLTSKTTAADQLLVSSSSYLPLLHRWGLKMINTKYLLYCTEHKLVHPYCSKLCTSRHGLVFACILPTVE